MRCKVAPLFYHLRICHVRNISPILVAHSSFLLKKAMHFYDRAASVGACVCVFFLTSCDRFFLAILRNMQKGRIYVKSKKTRT